MSEMSDVVDPAEGTTPDDAPGGPDSSSDVRATAVGFVAAAIGFWLTNWYLRERGAIQGLYAENSASADLDVWLVLLASIGALAFAVGVLSIGWLRELARDSTALSPRTISVWSMATGCAGAVLISTVIWGSNEAERAGLSGAVADATRLLTIGVALCSFPGLLYFAALRTVAGDDDWMGDGSTTVGKLFLLRRLLYRQTSLFGALLTLIVIATGLRRRTLLEIDAARPAGKQEMLDIPIEQVLLYGLTFAAFLALFYFLASSALSKVSESLVDTYAPIPDPGDDDVGTRFALRSQADTFISRQGPKQTFEASVAILSPLVTALIGAAIG